MSDDSPTPHPLQLTVCGVAALSATLRAEIVALCTAAFDEDFGQMYELLGPTMHVLATRDGVLVSHACWVTRWLQPGDQPTLRTAYIEAVATRPDVQRQGLGQAVMRRVAADIQTYDLGALSPAVEPFYERLGWEHWRGPTAIRTETGLVATPDEEIMILRTARTPALDLSARISAEWRPGDVW